MRHYLPVACCGGTEPNHESPTITAENRKGFDFHGEPLVV